MTTYTDRAHFERTIKSTEKPCLVQFSADWCGPCRAVTPLVQQVAQAYLGRAEVMWLDIDAGKDIAARFNVRSIPQILLFKGGIEVDRFADRPRIGRLYAFLDRHL